MSSSDRDLENPPIEGSKKFKIYTEEEIEQYK